MTNSKVNLLGLSRKMLRDYLLSIGEKPFRGDQIMKWIYHAGASDFSEMTDVSKALRERLSNVALLIPNPTTFIKGEEQIFVFVLEK